MARSGRGFQRVGSDGWEDRSSARERQWSTGRRGAGDAWDAMRDSRWCDAAEHSRQKGSRAEVEDGGR